MLIVAGHLMVDEDRSAAYLAGCADVVRAARATAGCLDFALSADLVEPGRINIFERWETLEAVAAFRGSGPSDDQSAQIRSASVVEYEIGNTRPLTG